jgi:excisionase family DNA binding protein
MELTSGPLTYTVEEAAQLLRIGRATAYALAKEWRATGGRSGLPVLELGRSLRVPRAALARLLDPAVPTAPDQTPDQPQT